MEKKQRPNVAAKTRCQQWVNFDRNATSSMFRHVGCTPKSGSKISVVASVMTGRGGLMMPPGA
jgi:hypothetical protein